MALSQTYFQDAHHFEVNDSQFIHIEANGNAIINQSAANIDYVSTIICQYVAAGATFDSAERYPPGKCHAGTRKKIIKKIIRWINDPCDIERILWLYGPAGSGKSALAQSICELLARSYSVRYGGSFFFAKGSIDRGNALKFFTTLSYQLAVHFPSMRAEINKALEHDPTLPTKSMEIQLLSLIVKPLLYSGLAHLSPKECPILIVDGLDECADDEGMDTQHTIIALMAKSIIEHDLSLRIMVASRPEYWIRDTFYSAPLSSITRLLSLRDDADADKDIKAYLIDGFKKIRKENMRVMRSVILPWPSETVVNHLVEQASGQYVYASTVLKFVGKSSRFINPQEQLRIITSPGPHRASAFSELDRLYATILSAYPRPETLKRVLGGLLVYPNPTIVKMFLGVDPTELVLVLDGLSSLIDIREPRALSDDEKLIESNCQVGSLMAGRDIIVFVHLSFCEFLKDEARSGVFYVDVDGVRDEITQTFFGMIHRIIDQKFESETEPHLLFNIERATYVFLMDEVALNSICHSKKDTLLLITQLTERLECLVQTYHGGSMTSLVCFTQNMGRLEYALEAFVNKIFFEEGWTEQVDEFRTVWDRFRDAVFMAYKSIMHKVMLYSEFKVTPPLVYFTEFYTGRMWLSIHALSDIPGVTSAISTVQHHHHIINLSYDKNEGWGFRLAAKFQALFDHGSATPFVQSEWKDQRIFITHHLLKSVFAIDQGSVRVGQCCKILKEHFFRLRSITDICNKEGSQKACKCLSLLELICDLSKWTTLRKYTPEETLWEAPNFIVSIICWIHKHLTNLQALKLLQDHDETLPQRMASTMMYLFEQFFLQHFVRSYNKKICVEAHSPTPYNVRPSAVLVIAQPLPQCFSWIEMEVCDLGVEHWHSKHPDIDWHTFHDEIFGKMNGSAEDSTPTVIDPSYWHPYLASRLLNALAKFLFGEFHQYFAITKAWNDESKLKFKKSLSYTTQSLPFAHPTSENLEALRLIVYLYPVAIKNPNNCVLTIMPEGIWPSIGAFLQKYPQSVLSLEELALFEAWLYSQDHSNIRNYVHRSC